MYLKYKQAIPEEEPQQREQEISSTTRVPEVKTVMVQANRPALALSEPGPVSQGAVAALDVLSRLLGAQAGTQDTFRLNLFEHLNAEEDSNGRYPDAARVQSPEVYATEAPAIQAFARGPDNQLLQIISSFQAEDDTTANSNDGDDLLALMDLAG